jgi:hypothetical protein
VVPYYFTWKAAMTAGIVVFKKGSAVGLPSTSTTTTFVEAAAADEVAEEAEEAEEAERGAVAVVAVVAAAAVALCTAVMSASWSPVSDKEARSTPSPSIVLSPSLFAPPTTMITASYL